MFKRFFGKGTPNKQSETSEEVREKQRAEADLSSTEAMVKIKSTMDDLQKRIDQTQKEMDTSFAKAKELKLKDPNNPAIKMELMKVKKCRERITQYNSILLQQQSTLSTVDDMQFINEMVSVMEVTKKALDSAYADSVDKLQELMDDINDKVYGVKEMMESLTVAQEDPEVDDLMAELDDVIAQEAAKSKEALPNAPASETVVQPPLPSVPTAVKKETSKNLEEDLEAMLQDLFCVC